MAKTYIETIKYMIVADFEVNGLVERPDIIGAIFGQSEGLLGANLDIKELQQNGKIGRIEIEYNQTQNKVKGILKLPCSISMIETAIIGASIETIEKVGPCDAYFKIRQIEDTRGLKRQQIKERAIELLGRLMQEEIPDTRELMDEIMDTFKTKDIITYGPDKLAAGPNIESNKEIIIVEGRADVLNLLKYGFNNVIATNGARVPKTLENITKNKIVTIFLDGDHGGDIQQQQLIKSIKVDFIARAPTGKEVEELTQKEINQALRKRIKQTQSPSSQTQTEQKPLNFNPILSKQQGIVKATKFSTTATDLKNPIKMFENKQFTKFSGAQPRPASTSDDHFNNMLSEIPNIERVDVSKGFRDKGGRRDFDNKRDSNFRDRNNRFDNRQSFNQNTDKKTQYEERQDKNNKQNKEEKTISKQKPLEDIKSKTYQKQNYESKTISKTTISKSNDSLKAELEKKITEFVDKKPQEPEKKQEVIQEKKPEPAKEQKKPKQPLPKITSEIKQSLLKIVDDVKDKNDARFLNEKFRRISNSSVSDLENKLKDFKSDKLFAIVVDAELTENIKNLAKEKGTQILVAKDTSNIKDPQIHILNYQELK